MIFKSLETDVDAWLDISLAPHVLLLKFAFSCSASLHNTNVIVTGPTYILTNVESVAEYKYNHERKCSNTMQMSGSLTQRGVGQGGGM